MMTAFSEKITPDKIRILKTGFDDLRDGSLYMILSTLFAVIGVIGIYASVGFGIKTLNVKGATAGVLVSFIIILVGLILGIVGIVKWKHGGEYFKEFDPARFGGAASGPKWMLWSIYIMVIAVIIALLGVVAKSSGVVITGLGIAIIGGLIGLIGYILFGVFLLRIKDLHVLYGVEVPDFTVDAILWFIGIIFSILTFVAVILIYVHAGQALNLLMLKEKNLASES